MPDNSIVLDIAVLTTKLEALFVTLSRIEAESTARATRQSDQHRAVMEHIEELRSTIAKQQGFINGALFTVKAFWGAVGAVAAGVVSMIATGHTPLK